MSSAAVDEENSSHTKSKKLRVDDGSKTSLSLQRWRILREVLIDGRSSLLTQLNTASVRRFNSFGMLQTKLLPRQKQDRICDGDWYLYTASTWPHFQMSIRHLPGLVKPETLLGFNNTGNVCVWPSEEVLTFHCLKHADMFSGKSVIELGGGMTCLAGVALGVMSSAVHIELTDGNEESVENLKYIIDRNQEKFENTTLSNRILRWGSGPLDEDLVGGFDHVLCADCLFFDEGRESLVTTIHSLLKDEGEAILFAPSRGETFDMFVELASHWFNLTVTENYDPDIWDVHCKMRERGLESYDPDIHYPRLLHMTKLPVSRENSSER